jgi:uncharacterized phiE125 gp8 family phage protein
MTYNRIKKSIVLTGPEREPVQLNSVLKLACKLDPTDSAEDSILQIWIQAAREIIENKCGRSFITQTRQIILDCFHWFEIELTFGKVQSVVSIEYYNSDNALTTLDPSEYYVDMSGDIARVRPVNAWPGTYNRPAAIKITYTAGYGDEPESVPAAIRSAIIMRTASLYENRQTVISGTNAMIVPEGEDSLLSTFIIYQDAID